MAYFLRFNGQGALNGGAVASALTSCNELRLEFDLSMPNSAQNDTKIYTVLGGGIIIIGPQSDRRMRIYYAGTAPGATFAFSNALPSATRLKLEIVISRSLANIKFFVNGALQTTTSISGGSTNYPAGNVVIGAENTGGSGRATFDLYGLKIYGDGSLIYDYDPSLSGGSGAILPDAVAARNASQILTWPADNSEWVFYSDGGAVTASATYDIGGIGFAISANEVDPAITAAVGYDIGGLSFAVSSTVAAPGVTTSLTYDIGSIGFSASATVGVNASGTYDIGDIDFAVSASAATNNAVASAAYDIGSIGFSVSSSVSVVNAASTSYDIGAIEFAVSSILVTNASGAVNYDIGGVTYSVNASAPLNEPERSLSGKDNPFWRKSIFFNTQRRY